MSAKGAEFSAEQEYALKAVSSGQSIFITGSAGVGKSFLLTEIVNRLPKETSFITASTGVAACNIGGTTLHSFAGIGLGRKKADSLAQFVLQKKSEAVSRWRLCEVLVIDEISMIDGILFDKVEHVARVVRGSEEPFGGIQVILCGDFLQLPPVGSKKFAFETKAWRDVVQETIVLKKVFRQTDVGFVKLLNRLRRGSVTPLDLKVLKSCRSTKFPDDGIMATRLSALRASCDDINEAQLKKLNDPTEAFKAVDFAYEEQYEHMMEKASRFSQVLRLKRGAQVMLLINKDMDRHLVNGSRGVVIGFEKGYQTKDYNEVLNTWKEDKQRVFATDTSPYFTTNKENCVSAGAGDGYPIVLFSCGLIEVIAPEKESVGYGARVIASRVQIPLKLAWAVSIHKSQGSTLDRVDVSLKDVFENGQSYVALSRVKSLEGLLLRDFDPSKVTACEKVIEFYAKADADFVTSSDEGRKELEAFVSKKRQLHLSDESNQSEVKRKKSSSEVK